MMYILYKYTTITTLLYTHIDLRIICIIAFRIYTPYIYSSMPPYIVY